jgi:hypothetical protein
MQVASRVKEDIEQRERALTWRGNQQRKVVIDFLFYLFLFSLRGGVPSPPVHKLLIHLLIERQSFCHCVQKKCRSRDRCSGVGDTMEE